MQCVDSIHLCIAKWLPPLALAKTSKLGHHWHFLLRWEHFSSTPLAILSNPKYQKHSMSHNHLLHVGSSWANPIGGSVSFLMSISSCSLIRASSSSLGTTFLLFLCVWLFTYVYLLSIYWNIADMQYSPGCRCTHHWFTVIWVWLLLVHELMLFCCSCDWCHIQSLPQIRSRKFPRMYFLEF